MLDEGNLDVLEAKNTFNSNLSEPIKEKVKKICSQKNLNLIKFFTWPWGPIVSSSGHTKPSIPTKNIFKVPNYFFQK